MAIIAKSLIKCIVIGVFTVPQDVTKLIFQTHDGDIDIITFTISSIGNKEVLKLYFLSPFVPLSDFWNLLSFLVTDNTLKG